MVQTSNGSNQVSAVLHLLEAYGHVYNAYNMLATAGAPRQSLDALQSVLVDIIDYIHPSE